MDASSRYRLFAGSAHLIDGQHWQAYHFAADDRLRCVAASHDAAALRDALGIEGLQKSVRAAIERRLRKLEQQS